MIRVPTRRDFLIRMASIGLSGLTSQLSAQVSQRVRRDVTLLDPNGPEIASLRRGIMVMKSRAANQPISWQAQAQIHQNHCPHANWFFLPWHRAYLHYFEQICRAASADPGFTLPYWNWTKDRRIPAVFWGSNNPLMDTTRMVGPTSEASLEFVGQRVIDNILATVDFLTFGSGRALSQRESVAYGILEGSPHNYVHGVFIRGNMAQFISPLDPIFWLHHANVDRLWTEWVGRGHSVPNDPRWLNFEFNEFVDTGGRPVRVRVGDMLNTTSLGYVYDNQIIPPPSGLRIITQQADLQVASENTRSASELSPLTVSLSPTQELRKELNSIAARSTEDPRPATVRVAIEGLQSPKNTEVTGRVFLNCSYLSAKTPATDPHYVGSIAFFTPESHGGDFSNSFYLDLTRALQTLREARLYDESQSVDIQLIPTSVQEQGPVEEKMTPTFIRLSIV